MEIVVEELVNIMEVVEVNNTMAGVVINTMEVDNIMEEMVAVVNIMVVEVNIMEEVSTMEAVTIRMKWPGQCLTIMEQ